jgi:hypothetical protein
MDQEERAQRIEAAMVRRAFGEKEWIEGTIDLAVELAAARDEHLSNIAFGAWCDQRFGEAALPRNERPILIRWGRDPHRIRAILEQSGSRSIQIIERSNPTNQGTSASTTAWAYRDEQFPERACDRCGEPYRGPAVYCSLKCALEDA